MSHNCGCPQNSPSQLTCPPTFSVPVDQFNCSESNQQPTSNAVLTYHQALSGFIVPSVGQQSALLVANGALFTPGQWIQFVNHFGIFRIISITGNTLQLSNAAADGVTAIAGNPAPPYQYPVNAAFVAVGDPRQQSLSEFAAYVASALTTLQSVCLDNLESQGANENVYLLGYLKSSLCDGDSGACLRKQSLAYIDNTGVLHFDGPISAEQFNVPVPDGGIPSNNTTPLNPNNGTGGGFLLPFYNPTTGLVTYIDLFSGIENNSAYSFYLSTSGVISLIPSGGRKVFWPDKEVHKGSGATYNGFTSADVDIATYSGEPVPSWAKYVKVRVNGNLFSGASDSIRVKLNTETVLYTSMETDYRGTYDQDFTIPITNGKFNLEIITYTDNAGTILGAANLGTGTNARAGFIRVAIAELLS
jgi:hypothetical protein